MLGDVLFFFFHFVLFLCRGLSSAFSFVLSMEARLSRQHHNNIYVHFFVYSVVFLVPLADRCTRQLHERYKSSEGKWSLPSRRHKGMTISLLPIFAPATGEGRERNGGDNLEVMVGLTQIHNNLNDDDMRSISHARCCTHKFWPQL